MQSGLCLKFQLEDCSSGCLWISGLGLGVRARENRSDVDISSDLTNIIVENNVETHLFTYCRS